LDEAEDKASHLFDVSISNLDDIIKSLTHKPGMLLNTENSSYDAEQENDPKWNQPLISIPTSTESVWRHE